MSVSVSTTREADAFPNEVLPGCAGLGGLRLEDTGAVRVWGILRPLEKIEGVSEKWGI